MATNPAFKRITKDARQRYAGFGDPQRGTGYPAGQVGTDLSAQQLQEMYNRQSAGPVQTGRLTLDDVIMKTLAQFGVLVVAAAVSWGLTPSHPTLGMGLWLGGMFLGLGLGLAIAFMKTVSVPLILTYAVVEGLFVGAFSRFLEGYYPGLIATAVLATLATFAGMLLGYKTGLVKVTTRSRRIFGLAVMGYALFSLVNVVALLAGWTSGWGFGGSGGMGIALSALGVGLASYSLAVDFDSIDYAIRTGAPQRYSWLLGHGLLVSIVWLYLEMVRLLARLRD